MSLKPRQRLTPIPFLSGHTWLCSGLLLFLPIFYYVFQPSSLIQSSWPHLSPGSTEGPGTALSSLCGRKASQLNTAPHLFRDDAHFPLRPGVWFPKLWAPYYHFLISASPILPNKTILWRCGSFRKQSHQHMLWWNFTNTRIQIPSAPCVDRLSFPRIYMSSL